MKSVAKDNQEFLILKWLLYSVCLLFLISISTKASEHKFNVLAEYSVTNDKPSVSGLKLIQTISPQRKLPEIKLHLRGDKICLATKDFINHGIQLLQKPDSNLIGIELDLFFDKKIDEILFELFYSSAGLKRFESQISKKISQPKVGEWTTLRFWLPNFKWLEKSRKIPHVMLDRPLTVSTDGSYQEIRRALHELENAFTSGFRIVEYTKPDINNILPTAHKLNPSFIENNLVKSLGVPALIIALIGLFIGFRSRLLIKFIVGLAFPFLLLLSFFNFQNIPVFENLEESEYQKVLQQMQNFHEQLKVSRESSEILFQQDLQKHRRTVDEALDRDIQKYGDFNYEFTSELKKLAKVIGGEFLIHGPEEGAQMYTTNPKMPNLKRRKEFLRSMFWPYANLLLKSADKTTQDKERESKELKKMIDFNKVQRVLEESFSTDLGVRKFFYKPEKLEESLVIDFDVKQMFQMGFKNRVFWTWYEDKVKRQKWLYTGYVKRGRLLTYLNSSLVKIVNTLNEQFDHKLDLDFYLSGFEKEPDLEPSTLANRNISEQVAQMCRQNNQEVFLPVIENNKLRFYYAKKFGVIEHYILCLSISGEEYLNRLKSRKNKVIYIALLILATVLGLSFFMSLSVTQPFETLMLGMDLISKGKLDSDVNLPGSNQFARCASAFNTMLVALREKEFISKFVSRMALSNISQQSAKSRKELVTMMYCSIPDLEDLMESLPMQEAVDTLNQCLQIIQNQVVKFDGSVDKFTGHASLCVFIESNQNAQPLEAAIAIRNEMTNWNLNRSRQNLKPLLITIGIAKGKVILGHIGSEKRKDYTCIGDTVNMAARLGSIKFSDTPYTQILVDEKLVSSNNIQQTYSLTRHDNVSIKGKQLKQVLYELD